MDKKGISDAQRPSLPNPAQLQKIPKKRYSNHTSESDGYLKPIIPYLTKKYVLSHKKGYFVIKKVCRGKIVFEI
jgi:hypothetical protein